MLKNSPPIARTAIDKHDLPLHEILTMPPQPRDVEHVEFQFEHGKTLHPLRLPEGEALAQWLALPRAERAVLEQTMSGAPVRRYEHPEADSFYAHADGADWGSTFRVGLIQPHHSALDTEIEVVTVNGAHVLPDAWEMPFDAIAHRVIVMMRSGEALIGLQAALRLAFEGENVLALQVGENEAQWLTRLRRHEVIRARDSIDA